MWTRPLVNGLVTIAIPAEQGQRSWSLVGLSRQIIVIGKLPSQIHKPHPPFVRVTWGYKEVLSPSHREG